jgi:hypothetical protein
MQRVPQVSACRTPFQGSTGAGGRQRSSPTGGAAKGTPLKIRMEESAPVVPSRAPPVTATRSSATPDTGICDARTATTQENCLKWILIAFPRRHGPPTSIDGWAKQFKARKAQIGQQSAPRMGLDPPRGAFLFFRSRCAATRNTGRQQRGHEHESRSPVHRQIIARFPPVVRGSDSECRHGLELT